MLEIILAFHDLVNETNDMFKAFTTYLDKTII